MECVNYNLLISIIAVIIAFMALIVTLIVRYISIQYQIIALLNSQLADKAKDCNSNLDPNDLSTIPRRNDKFSGILSSIIVAEEILNNQVQNRFQSNFLKFYDLQSIIDQFYLQLHTTIRVFLQKGNIEKNYIENDDQFEKLKSQYKRSIKFLEISIARDKNSVFEQLHSISVRRNKKYKKELNGYTI